MYSDKIYAFASAFEKCAGHPRADYMRAYMRNRYRNKRDWLLKLLGGKCSSCGTDKNLNVDHKNSADKGFRAADVHSVSDAKIKKELPNLQILCTKCHKEKTQKSWDRAVPKAKCGTYWKYRKHGCRCKPCVDAYKAKLKEWRENRKSKKEGGSGRLLVIKKKL